MSLTLTVTPRVFELLREGQEVTVSVNDAQDLSRFRVFSLSGDPIGRFRMSTGTIPDWWRDGSLIEARITEKNQRRGLPSQIVAQISKI